MGTTWFLFRIPYSVFPIPYSLFAIPYSLFPPPLCLRFAVVFRPPWPGTDSLTGHAKNRLITLLMNGRECVKLILEAMERSIDDGQRPHAGPHPKMKETAMVAWEGMTLQAGR